MFNLKQLCSLSLFLMASALHAQSFFVENKGQVLDFNENPQNQVKYYYSHNNASLYFESNRVVYNFKEDEALDLSKFANDKAALEEARRVQKADYHRMDMVFLNAQPNPQIHGSEAAQGLTHFYLNKRNGIRDVRSFQQIRYEQIYPNIDAVFYSNAEGMKYDLILNPGASLSDIRIKFEGADVRLENNILYIKNSLYEMVEEIPLSFIDGNTDNRVEVRYILHSDSSIGFELQGNTNYSTLTIDPVLEWGTYFNLSSGTDRLYHIDNHLDNDGNYFSYGMAQNGASTYPVVNPGAAYTSTANGSADAYFVKFNANRQLVWSTYLGGSGYDEIYDGEIITTFGNTLHLVGERITTGAPFTNGGGFYQDVAARNFWARFDKNTGTMLHLTSLSSGYKPSIAISNSGLVAISNDVYDSNVLPIENRAGAYNQAVNGGFKDMGLLLFNAAFTQIWGTFLGGPGSQENFLCAFDNSNNIYFVGETSTNGSLVNLPGAYNQNTVGGGTDVWLGKFTSTGQLVWSTLYGGNGSDARRGQQGHGARILVHPTSNELILAFNTTSNNLPLVNLAGAYNKGVPTHIDFGGSSGSFWNYAAYFCKFSTAGALNYATYYYSGTGGGDIIENIAFGACGKFYIGGAGEASKTLTGAAAGYNLINSTGAGRSGYITMLNSSTFAFEWDSYLNTNISSDANVAANINQAPFYSMATLYYQNLPTVNPGSGAYFNATSTNPAGAGVGISQFHPSLPPIVSGATICAGSSTSLTASGGMGAPYNWYLSPTDPTPVYTGSSYSVSPGSTTTYYVSSGSGICASPKTPVTVTVDPAAPAPTITVNGPFCAGGTINLQTNAVVGATYFWSGPNGFSSSLQNPSITNISTANSGTYSLYLVLSGCTSTTATVNLTVNPIPANPVIGSNSPLCSGQNLLLTSNTITNAVYYWSGPNSFSSNDEDPVISNVTTAHAGNYSLFVEVNGCSSATVNHSVTVNATPSVPAITSNSPLCAGSTLNLSASTAAGTYVWTGPNGFTSNMEDPSIPNAQTTHAGTYQLVLVNNGCTSTVASTNVVVNALPSAPTIGSNAPLCVGNTLNLTANLVPGASYFWTGPNGFTSGLQNPSIPNAQTTHSGTYSLYLVQNGCSSTISQTSVTVNAIPATPSASSNSPVCSGSNIQLSTPTVSGATYVWSGPNSFSSSAEDPLISNAQGSHAGTYNLIVVVNGCSSALATTNVVVNQTPTSPVIGSNSPLCAGNNLELYSNSSSTGTYVWSGPNGFTSALHNPIISNASAIHAGTYNLILVENGCSSVVSSTVVSVQPGSSISAGTVLQPSLCGATNGSIEVLGSGNGEVFWIGTQNGNSGPVTLPYTISNLPAGSYDVYFVAASGCTSNVLNVLVSDPNPPATPVISSNSPLCSGDNLQLTANTLSGATYVWSGPNGFTSSLEDPILNAVTTAANGTYSLFLVQNGCSSATATLNVLVNQTPATPVLNVNQPNCAGDSILFSTPALSGATYVWSGPNGFSSSLQNPFITPANATHNGNYTLQLVANGCSSSVSTQTITVHPKPVLTIDASSTLVCEGSAVTLTGSGAPTLSWDNGISNGVPFLIYATNTYTLTGTNAEGCSTSQSITITVTPNSGFNVLITPSDPDSTICEGETISLSASGAGNYLWLHNNSASTTVQVSPTQDSVFSVVGNVGICSDTTSILISVSPAPVYQFLAQDTLICLGDSVVLTAQGIGADVLWNTGEITSSITVTPSTNSLYSFEATNADNCSSTYSVLIEVFGNPDLDLADSILICNSATQISAGSGFSAYLWSNGEQTESISVNAEGWYAVTVENAAGCQATDSIYAIFSPFPSHAGIIGENEQIVCLNGSFVFAAQGGTSYMWYGPANYQSTDAENEINPVQNYNEGWYVVHIFNPDQCYIQDSVQLILGEDKDCVEITELITPNNDGKNDVLFLSFVAQYPNHKLSIFNRWGSLVYEKKNYQNDWSGIANTGALAGKGEKLPVGTYFYIFDPGNGDKPKRGFIELQY